MSCFGGFPRRAVTLFLPLLHNICLEVQDDIIDWSPPKKFKYVTGHRPTQKMVMSFTGHLPTTQKPVQNLFKTQIEINQSPKLVLNWFKVVLH